MAVADPGPWTGPFEPVEAGPGRTILAAGNAFVLERWTTEGEAAGDVPDGTMLMPLASGGTLDGEALEAGSVWAAQRRVSLDGPIDLLAAYPGGAVRDGALERRP